MVGKSFWSGARLSIKSDNDKESYNNSLTNLPDGFNIKAFKEKNIPSFLQKMAYAHAVKSVESEIIPGVSTCAEGWYRAWSEVLTMFQGVALTYCSYREKLGSVPVAIVGCTALMVGEFFLLDKLKGYVATDFFWYFTTKEYVVGPLNAARMRYKDLSEDIPVRNSLISEELQKTVCQDLAELIISFESPPLETFFTENLHPILSPGNVEMILKAHKSKCTSEITVESLLDLLYEMNQERQRGEAGAAVEMA
jgi:hypothetical protein